MIDDHHRAECRASNLLFRVVGGFSARTGEEDTTRSSCTTAGPGASPQLTGEADFWHPTGMRANQRLGLGPHLIEQKDHQGGVLSEHPFLREG